MTTPSPVQVGAIIDAIRAGETAEGQLNAAAYRVHTVLFVFIAAHKEEHDLVWQWNRDHALDGGSLWNLYAEFYGARLLDGEDFSLITQQPYGEHDIESAHFPLSWLWLSDADLNAELDTLFQGKLAHIRAAEKRKEDEEEARERAEFERLKERFAS